MLAAVIQEKDRGNQSQGRMEGTDKSTQCSIQGIKSKNEGKKAEEEIRHWKEASFAQSPPKLMML